MTFKIIINSYLIFKICHLKKNKTFIAKEGTTFDEEKNVATKVPVEKIEIDNLVTKKTNEKQAQSKNNEKLFFLISINFTIHITFLL